MYDAANAALPPAGSSNPLHPRRDRASAGCRLCGDKLHRELIDFGPLPATTHAIAGGIETPFPLRVWVCDACGLVQTADTTVDTASVGDGAALPLHLPGFEDQGRKTPAAMVQRWRLGPASRVVHIGAGDQDLIRHLQGAGVRVLDNPLQLDAAQGFDAGCFNAENAVEIAVRNGRADLVVVDEVVTRVSNLFEFAAGLASLVRPDGIVLITTPHVLSILQQAQFDAFRHDVRNYLSLGVLERLLCSVGLRVFDAERVPDEGGMLRIQACPISARHAARPGLKAVRMAEAMTSTESRDLYSGFAARVAAVRAEVCAFVRIRRAAGRRAAAFGATSRGAAMMNVCELTAADVECVADQDIALFGRVMPGSQVPIVSLAAIAENPPDDLLVLPWPQAQEVLPLLAGLRHRGVQLWTLLPRINRL